MPRKLPPDHLNVPISLCYGSFIVDDEHCGTVEVLPFQHLAKYTAHGLLFTLVSG